jgi:N-hydroxyarylamine O-acetyltransferase
VFDLDAYLARIGLDRRASLAGVHRAHVIAIPFENLDPQRGVPISLDQGAIAAKLVTARRGGYCFEHNLLLKAAFEALGARVDLLLARSRYGASRDTPRPRNHVLLRVEHDGAVWQADVGWGVGLLEPIPFGLGGPYEQSGWSWRVVEDGDELVLQSAAGPDWEDDYGFIPEPVPMIDIETSNWFTCTYPRSPFVTHLIVVVCRADGTWLELSDGDGALTLNEWTPAGISREPVHRADIPTLLETRFALHGFKLDADARVVAIDQAITS